MSKIKREQVMAYPRERVCEFIEAREAEFSELVEAVREQHMLDSSFLSHRTKMAIQPFLPEPKLSEEIDSLAEKVKFPTSMHMELHAIAEKVRKLEEGK